MALGFDERFQIENEFFGEHEESPPEILGSGKMAAGRDPAHLGKAGLARVAINQVEQRPHDRLHR